MPYRQYPLVTGETYHVFNRSVAKQPIFSKTADYQRALDVIGFYQYQKPRLRFSHYNRLSLPEKQEFFNTLKISTKQIQLLAYCLMPNHVHFLVKESKSLGISNFMRNFQNSYAKYFNTKTKRSGSVFQSMFKAVRMESDEQLLHVCRYIHINPLTAFLIRELKDLETYPWSSFRNYIGENNDLIETKIILRSFKTVDAFKKFTADQIDYQRQLDHIKHLTLE